MASVTKVSLASPGCSSNAREIAVQLRPCDGRSFTMQLLLDSQARARWRLRTWLPAVMLLIYPRLLLYTPSEAV